MCKIKPKMYFLLAHADIGVHNDLLQLRDLKESTMIRIDLLELFSELLDLISLEMLDEYIDCCSFEE